ncbi:uncharacterized protein Z519_03433 [Cladophialophora bantiana CBS 173.52]|uniref:NTF2-like domain-containing protein n=1 Tax=Cladophialophora bantiana (strain ATCC 10958 / CBS 173.52 / CDC B-1940 / NIH 8579) TaxID=1442370 RepID=A0A0D2II00_CLAB1|nr:uncharacterized protein Z519_03433 [Cladophialophora bantiana CBS 173.52]KIW96364.1 hypothetical protein Z519_03433 [Cladophialophora bantiana CBS 173.52]
MRSAILTILTLVITALAQGGDWSDWHKNKTHDVDDNYGQRYHSHAQDKEQDRHRDKGMSKGCLKSTDADYLVKGYTYLLQYPGGPDFNKTANRVLSDQFVVWSDSINTLGNRALGTPVYPSLQAFIASQAATPALPTVQTLSTSHTCDQIFWRWNASGIGNKQMRVQGIISFDVDVDRDSVKIDTVYSEFNIAAFWTDQGNKECQGK